MLERPPFQFFHMMYVEIRVWKFAPAEGRGERLVPGPILHIGQEFPDLLTLQLAGSESNTGIAPPSAIARRAKLPLAIAR